MASKANERRALAVILTGAFALVAGVWALINVLEGSRVKSIADGLARQESAFQQIATSTTGARFYSGVRCASDCSAERAGYLYAKELDVVNTPAECRDDEGEPYDYVLTTGCAKHMCSKMAAIEPFKNGCQAYLREKGVLLRMAIKTEGSQ